MSLFFEIKHFNSKFLQKRKKSKKCGIHLCIGESVTKRLSYENTSDIFSLFHIQFQSTGKEDSPNYIFFHFFRIVDRPLYILEIVFCINFCIFEAVTFFYFDHIFIKKY